jgi:hypothetical protein
MENIDIIELSGQRHPPLVSFRGTSGPHSCFVGSRQSCRPGYLLGEVPGGAILKRPKRLEQVFRGKPKRLRKNVTKEELDQAVSGARYSPSDYHCKVGGRLARRLRPQTPCPRDFTIQEAGDAIREAIRSRHVSEDWIDEFPRYCWRRIGDRWYEAATRLNDPGNYHAYPIEDVGLPPGLKK